MKLIARYNRTTLLATIIVLMVSGVCYYFMIRYVLIHQLDKDLKVEEQEINESIRSIKTLPTSSKTKDQWVEFSSASAHVGRAFSSYTFLDRKDGSDDYDSRRQLVFPVNVNGTWYRVAVSKSQIETEDLLKLIFSITLGILLLLLLTLFLVNRFLLNKLWNPFNTTLQALKQFNFSDNSSLQLGTTNINEFKELNDSVTVMMDRIHQDYTSLKRFTENASHEMQTPLAVIYSKLDLLIQDEHFDRQQTKHLQDIYSSVTKLTKLNKSLLLLTKIENNQFQKKENVQLDVLIKEKLQQFEDSILQKELVIGTFLEAENLDCNRMMLDILVGNLINNAIRYNLQQGSITMRLSPNKLEISNTSNIPELDSGLVFQRFYRHVDTKQDGNGLGLSIVKQICEVEGFKLDYSYVNEKHSFVVHFKMSTY